MHDEIAMGILHGGAYLHEQLDALADEQGAIVAVRVDGFAVDVLHHQIGRAVIQIAAVDQSRDGRMSERRQDVPLAVQAIAHARMQRRVVQHLDGDGLLILGIIALAAVHRAHAAVPEDGSDAIVPDAGSDQAILVLHQQGFGRFADGIQQGILGSLIGCEQRLHRTLQFGVIAAGARQAHLALGGRGVHHLFKQRLNLLPAGARNHGGARPAISSSSHARARRISRCTVAADAPAAAAI